MQTTKGYSRASGLAFDTLSWLPLQPIPWRLCSVYSLRSASFRNQSFSESISLLNQLVQFIEVKTLRQEIQECKSFIQDQADIPFLALAKHLNLPIWSNDSHLKEQSVIQVFSTLDLLKLLPQD